MALSKSLPKGQFPTFCKLCEVKTKLPWKCMDCDILMCNRCKERIHPNLKNARNHKVIDVNKIGLIPEEVDFNNIPCKGHKGQVCVMFCKSCDQLVCTKCIAKIHNGHGFVEISEGYQIKIERLKEEIKRAENEKYMETKKKIQVHQISLKREVDRYSEILLKELDQKWEESKAFTLETNLDRNIDEIIQSWDVEKIFEVCNELDLSFEEEPLEYNFTSVPSFIPGEISQYNVGSLQHTSTDITLQVIKEYTTKISDVYYMSPCFDSLWISNAEVLQKVQPEENNLKVISSFDIEIRGMAVTPSNDLLLLPRGESVLKQISSGTNKVTDTNYSVDPLHLTALHVTGDGKIVMGARNFGEKFSATGRRVVISMDKAGRHRTVYEYDRNNQHILTYPHRLTSTHSGNICVVDRLSSDSRGRVVVLGQGGDIINIYTGHPDVNTKDKPFQPVSVATTISSDNIIVSNKNIGVLHILDNAGHLLSHLNTREIGIQSPYSIALSTTGKVYIGCTRAKTSPDNKAKLYEVKILD